MSTHTHPRSFRRRKSPRRAQPRPHRSPLNECDVHGAAITPVMKLSSTRLERAYCGARRSSGGRSTPARMPGLYSADTFSPTRRSCGAATSRSRQGPYDTLGGGSARLVRLRSISPSSLPASDPYYFRASPSPLRDRRRRTWSSSARTARHLRVDRVGGGSESSRKDRLLQNSLACARSASRRLHLGSSPSRRMAPSGLVRRRSSTRSKARPVTLVHKGTSCIHAGASATGATPSRPASSDAADRRGPWLSLEPRAHDTIGPIADAFLRISCSAPRYDVIATLN